MPELQTFVSQAREKGLSDDQIRSALTAQGWDTAVAEAALLGLEVPKGSGDQQAIAQSHPQGSRPSLSPMMAALHHVLLWFFVGSSAVTIAGVVASLSGLHVTTQTLASMIAVTIVTFVPYAIFFTLYLLKLRKTPDLIPGKVWSIITICLHSVTAMIAAITLVVSLITQGEYSVQLSAGLIMGLNLVVILTYGFAAFGKGKLRKIVVWAHIPVLLALFGTLFIMSVMQLGPASHDEQLRKDLAATVTAVYENTLTNKRLPENGNGLVKSSEITYEKKTDSTYEVCGVFQTTSRNSGYSTSYRNYAYDDSYVYESQFEGSGSGKQCFDFTSSAIEDMRVY
ncbi:MAG: hypothetical protein HZB75_00860 [Candidatus Saccharibacteria bacterium]|nr:MAG: hypothetical protein HZB75_00860 [Candidatus Saccharibacteria bacterium]